MSRTYIVNTAPSMNIKSVTILLFLLRFSTCFSLEEFLWSSLDSASVPTSPINITRDATEVEDTTTTASEDGEVQGIIHFRTCSNYFTIITVEYFSRNF